MTEQRKLFESEEEKKPKLNKKTIDDFFSQKNKEKYFGTLVCDPGDRIDWTDGATENYGG